MYNLCHCANVIHIAWFRNARNWSLYKNIKSFALHVKIEVYSKCEVLQLTSCMLVLVSGHSLTIMNPNCTNLLWNRLVYKCSYPLLRKWVILAQIAVSCLNIPNNAPPYRIHSWWTVDLYIWHSRATCFYGKCQFWSLKKKKDIQNWGENILLHCYHWVTLTFWHENNTKERSWQWTKIKSHKMDLSC